jgi:hypothetical protein
MFSVLLLLPFILTQLAEPHEFMGVMILLFFIVNPITAAVINSMIGKDIKKLWWIPILFPIMFLLSYWLVLNEIILDLTFYAGIYLIIGLVFMIDSWLIAKYWKRKPNFLRFFESIRYFFHPTYEPLICSPVDIFDLMQEDLRYNTGGIPLVIEYNGNMHRIGSCAELNSKYQFTNYEFYVDDLKYNNFNDFWASAMIDGEYLYQMQYVKIIAQELDGEGEYGDIRAFTLIDERYPKQNKHSK